MIEITGSNNIYAEIKNGGYLKIEPKTLKRKKRTIMEWLRDAIEIPEETDGYLSLQDSTCGELSLSSKVYVHQKTGYIYD